jgi:hypothetical protein
MMKTRWKGAQLFEPGSGLPASAWYRILALWGFTSVPFFAAFDGEDYQASTLQGALSYGSGEERCG